MNALSEANSAISFLGKHGAMRTNGTWLTRDYEVLHAEPVEAAKRLRALLIEKSHRDERGGLRKITRG